MAAIGTTVQSTLDPWAVQLKLGEADLRYALAGFAQPAPGSVMSYKSGVFAGGSISGTTLGDADHSGMRVTVGATGANPTALVNIGNCLIDTPGQGPYLCGLDSQKTVALASPHATQRRLDLIVARVYDDRNTAIASAAGDRRFVVQAVTGDNTSGTPTLPTATLPANGWIPLASVLIEANGTTLTVTNMRGPGLVARGGRRILYGNDAKITSAAFLEAGAYAGDQRYVVGHPFPNQTYYVSSDAGVAGWRGDGGKLVYTASPPDTGNVRVQGTTSTQADMVSVAIPAFGIPVVVTPSARINPVQDKELNWELRTLVAGVGVNYQGTDTYGWGGAVAKILSVGPMTVGPYTAAVTAKANIFFKQSSSSSTGITYDTSLTGQHLLQVIVEPANIDPIRMWL
jgi:hypothetical protein